MGISDDFCQTRPTTGFITRGTPHPYSILKLVDWIHKGELMKIGITERGDAGVDHSWYGNLVAVDGAVIITKKMSEKFNDLMLSTIKPCILHCTCTGWGGTWLEPNVPDYRTQISFLKKLLDAGFPAERAVLRLDPVIPTKEGLEKACAVLDYVQELKLPVTRVRFSVLDEYKHVKERLQSSGREPFYPDGRFQASAEQKRDVIRVLSAYPFMFESCAEDWAATASGRFTAKGCISADDIKLLGLSLPVFLAENMQHRSGCHCLSCKTELLGKKKQCPNRCVYCYWRDK